MAAPRIDFESGSVKLGLIATTAAAAAAAVVSPAVTCTPPPTTPREPEVEVEAPTDFF